MSQVAFTNPLTQRAPASLQPQGIVGVASGSVVSWRGLQPALTGPLIAFTNGSFDSPITENAGFHEVLAPLGVYRLVLTDNAQVVDPITGGRLFALSVAEALDITSTSAGAHGAAVTINDNLGVAVSPSATARFLEAVAEALGAASSAAVANAYAAVLTEHLAFPPGVNTATYIWRAGGLAVESLDVTAAADGGWGLLIQENVRIATIATGNFIVAMPPLQDSVRFRDKVILGIPVAALEHVGLADLMSAVRAVQILEQLNLLGTLAVTATLNASVVERLRLRDFLVRFFGADITEALGLGESGSGSLLAFAAILDQLGIAAVPGARLLAKATVAETLDLSAEQLLQMIWSGLLVDGIEVDLGFVDTNGDTSAWVMNTRTGAVTEYTNFAFNSMVQTGNICLGASSEGLFELLGNDDAGQSIEAVLRGGYAQFGGTQLSRLKEAYISVRAPNGQVMLKIITADGAQYLYQVDTRSMRNTKVVMGKGMRARYFAYELTIGGQDFDLDTIEFVPIVVQRRV